MLFHHAVRVVALAIATMALALLLVIGDPVHRTFVSCWVVLLAFASPLLARTPFAITAWLGLVPVVALTTLFSLESSLTRSWHWNCGTGQIGIVICAPAFVGACVVGAGASIAFLVRVTTERVRIAIVVGSTLLALGALGATGLLAGGRAHAVAPDALLRSTTHTLGTMPAGASDAVIDGSRLTRTCDPECMLVVDGIATMQIEAPEGDIELAEGLGYRFVRTPGSEPSAWLAYRRGDRYGTELTALDLDRPVTTSPGLGLALAVTTLMAFAYLALAARPAWRIARRRPDLAAATYRGAVSQESLVHEWRGLSQHCAMATMVIVLGLVPTLIALRTGLIVAF